MTRRWARCSTGRKTDAPERGTGLGAGLAAHRHPAERVPRLRRAGGARGAPACGGHAGGAARGGAGPGGGGGPPPRGRLPPGGLVPPLGPDDSVAVSLPGGVAERHTVSLPFTDPRRIEQVLPAEVEGAIPFDLDEVVWDHAVLGQSGGKTDVLVGIVRKAVLREFLEALAAAGVEPRVVTLAPLALSALGERGVLVPEGAPPLTAALLDGGPDRADLALVDAGRPVLARSLATSNAQAWAAAATDETARNRLLSQMLRDLKISLRTKRLAPQRLLLAGPLVTLPGAAERLTAETQLPAEPVALPAGGGRGPPPGRRR